MFHAAWMEEVWRLKGQDLGGRSIRGGKVLETAQRLSHMHNYCITISRGCNAAYRVVIVGVGETPGAEPFEIDHVTERATG